MKLTTFLNNLKSFIKANHKRILINLLIISILTPLFVYYIQLHFFAGDVDKTWAFFDQKREIARYSTAIFFLLSITVISLIGNVIIAESLIFSTLIALMYANTCKYASRAYPLLPDDFMMASDANAFVNWIDIGDLLWVIVSIALTIFLGVVISKYYQEKLPPKKLKKYVSRSLRLTVAVASFVAFLNITDIIRHPKGDNYEKIDNLKTELVAWDQDENYTRNGFIIGFLYNVQARKIEPPEGYTEEKAKEILAKYQKLADEENKTRTSLADEDINIIYIMNESFFDPSILSESYPYTGGDVTPNLHKLMRKYPHGTIYSPEYGGNTANVEFEALTGFSNRLLGSTFPYMQIVAKQSNFPALPNELLAQGYQTTALHPFSGSMYKRNIAYKNMGFQNFYDIDDFEYTDTCGKYTSDESSYKQLLKQLNSTEQKQFIFLVTMQNHMPYGENFDNYKFISQNPNISDWNNQQISDYLELLHESDKALGQLIEELDGLDKKVALVFWGDHLPGLYNDIPEEQKDLRQHTPLLIYHNFNLPPESQPVPSTPLTPNYINLVFTNTTNTHLTYQQTLLNKSSLLHISNHATSTGSNSSYALDNTETQEYLYITHKVLSK